MILTLQPSNAKSIMPAPYVGQTNITVDKNEGGANSRIACKIETKFKLKNKK